MPTTYKAITMPTAAAICQNRYGVMMATSQTQVYAFPGFNARNFSYSKKGANYGL